MVPGWENHPSIPMEPSLSCSSSLFPRRCDMCFMGLGLGNQQKERQFSQLFFSSETFIDMFHFIGLPTREIEIFIDFRMQFYSVLPCFFPFFPRFFHFSQSFPRFFPRFFAHLIPWDPRHRPRRPCDAAWRRRPGGCRRPGSAGAQDPGPMGFDRSDISGLS